MTTAIDRPGRPLGAGPPAAKGSKVTAHPILWVIHAGLAHVFLPGVVGPAFVAALAGVPLVNASGTALILLLVGVALGGGAGWAIGPRSTLFPARPQGSSRRGLLRRGAR